ncbi:MAG: DUF2059 domain-containing protein [Chitinophagales bacterium]|nr:DUF2059 domain-containing protein [Bacteroidota bacterium]
MQKTLFRAAIGLVFFVMGHTFALQAQNVIWRDTTITVSEAEFFQSEQEKKEMAANITELMQLLQMESRAESVYTEIVGICETEVEGLPQAAWDTLVPWLVKQSAPTFQEIYASAFKNNFTSKEVGDIVAFYKTDTGRKFLAKQEGVFWELLDNKSQWAKGALTNLTNKALATQAEYMLKNQANECKKYHDGDFYMYDPQKNRVEWNRKKDIQTETDSLYTHVYKVNWENECKYTLTVESSTNPGMEQFIGSVMEVQITGINPETKSYTYRSWIPSLNLGNKGEIFKE